MADNIEKIILDSSDFINPLTEMMKLTEKAEKGFKDYAEEVEKSQKKAANEVEKTGKQIEDSFKKTDRQLLESRKEVVKAAKDYSIFGVSISDVEEKLKIYRNGLRSTMGSITDFTRLSVTQRRGVVTLTNAVGGGRTAFIALAKSINIAKTALLASGIGAAVVAVGALTAALTTSQKGMDKLGQANAYVSASIDVLIDKASKLGERLLDNDNIFLDGVKTLFGPAGVIFGYTELGKEMDEAGKAAARLKAEMQELEREQSNANVQTAINRKELEEYKIIAEDTTKTFNERLKAIRAANAIEQEQISKQIELYSQRLLILQEDAKTRKKDDLTSNLLEQNEIIIELATREAESATKRNELSKQENALLKEREDKLKASQKRLEDITVQLVTLGNEAKLISDSDAFNFGRESQIKALQALKKELQEVAKITGNEVGEELELIDQLIKGIANTSFTGEFEKLKTTLPKTLDSLEKDAKIEIDLVITPEEEKSLEDQIDAITGKIIEKLNKVNESLFEVDSIVSPFADVISESLQIQLDANQKLLDQKVEQRELLEQEIDKEKDLFERNLANNLGTKQDEHARLLAEEEKYIEEQNRLRQQAQQLQILQDTLTQSTSLTTAASNIIKGFSSIPIVGLPLGIAAVGTMLAFFAKTKIDAFKATKLSGGADKVSDHFGFTDEFGDTDKGRNSGYRVVNNRTGRDTNVIISGREMLLPEDISFKYKDLLESMKNGSLEKYDLGALIKDNNSVSSTGSTTIINNKAPESDGLQWIPYITKDGKHAARLTKVSGKREGDIIIFG